MKNFLLILLLGILAYPAFGQELQIIGLEVFVDEDPGIGFGTPIKITTGTTIDQTYELPLGGLGLSEGFHTIGARVELSNGQWGFYETRLFFIQPDPDDGSSTYNIAAVEYFFDEDPGVGNGTPLDGVVAGSVIDITSILPTSLETGWHVIGIRSKNTIGQWGFTEKRPVYVDGNTITTGPTPKISKLEYFYNDDPGIGQGTAIEIDPDAETVDIESMLLPTSEEIPVGTNEITIRAQNDQGEWGFGKTQEFEVLDDCDQPTANFEVDMACAGETIFFNDLSTNLQDDATYRWYLDGDNELDATNKGDVSFTYQNPGTYTVSLAISQGQICYDSMAMELVVKAKPIVIFNADPVTVGESTNFDVTQYNVDPTSVWSWDFDGDGTVDDNTVGSVTYTYPSAGDYQAEIVVTDNNGCGTSFSREVTVQPPGGGGGNPVVNFQATTECQGAETQFTDLSQSIPTGATYSWDFDGDGNSDNNTIGNTTFTYSEAGSFSAVLSITLPDESTLMHTEIVHVRPDPKAAFTATEVCIGEATIFSSETIGIDDNTTFSWDFDGDGVEDDNTIGDVEYTYAESGQFAVVLTVNNGEGCFDIAVRNVFVQPEPEAAFSVTEACSGQPVQFMDMSTGTNGSSAYAWDFDGDGTVDSTTPGDVTYTYPIAGEYTAVLTVDNGSGCTGTTEQTITFGSDANPDFSTEAVCFGETTTFVDQSTDVDASAVYSWDFDGDGSIDSQNKGNTTFTYQESGIYTASLTINAGDCPSIIQKTVTVYQTPQSTLPETAEFCEGESLTLDAGSGFVQYLWSDESTSRTIEVEVPDTYSVTVTNEQGCESTATVEVQEQGQVTSAFQASIEPLELTANVTFENMSEDATSYLWDFGDGTTSAEKNPVHEYQDINVFFGSVYEVCLTAFNDCNSEKYCDVLGLVVTANQDEISNEVRVYPNPATNTFILSWYQQTTNAQVRLIDISGSNIWTRDFPKPSGAHKYEMDIHGVKPGQYIVEIIADTSVYRRKLIVQ